MSIVQFITLIVFINLNVDSLDASTLRNNPALAFIVSIQYKRHHVCSGVLISNEIVLTTGHCLSKIEHQKFLTIQPNYNDEIHSPTDPEKRYKVNRIEINPEMKTLAHDVALMKLNEPVEHSNDIEPITIINETKTDEQFTQDDYLIMAAWGFTKEWKFHDKLSLIRIRLSEQSNCSKHFKMSSEIVDQLICGVCNHNKICRGDGGSPVFKFDPIKGTKKLVSLLVYSTIKCSVDMFLSVKVANNYQWITETVQKLS